MPIFRKKKPSKPQVPVSAFREHQRVVRTIDQFAAYLKKHPSEIKLIREEITAMRKKRYELGGPVWFKKAAAEIGIDPKILFDFLKEFELNRSKYVRLKK